MPPKFDLLDEVYPARTHSGSTIALLPAGGEVWEDFLDSIGVSLEKFCHEGPGGWMLGYIDALSSIGVRTVLIFFSARVTSPLRFRDTASGTIISVLPVSSGYRALREKLVNLRPVVAESTGTGRNYTHRLRHTAYDMLVRVAPYLSTPLGSLARELRRADCRAILCQEYEYFRFDTCVLLGRLLRLPVFATFQGNDFELNPISRAVRPIAIRSCNGLFVAPRAEIERVLARYKVRADRVAQIFNPVDLAMWGAVDRDEARAAFNLPPNARVAVWHGRVAMESKGLDILLDAWAQVCQQRPGQDLRLLMMGTGQDADQMRQRIESQLIPNVLWINEYITDRSAIRRFLSAGDVYVFPSRYEGFAVAPIEAMACGLPVVAAQASGIPDIFDKGEASGGIVVPRGDTAAFAQALGRVLDDQVLRQDLGRLARGRVEQAFSLEAVGRQLHTFLLHSGLSATDSENQETRVQVSLK